ncbi:hypothetical protein ACFQZ4_14450 [Catellatospora coxensis]
MPATFGEAALFRAAEQRSLLPGRLYGADTVPVTIGKPPEPDVVVDDLELDEREMLTGLHEAAVANADGIRDDIAQLVSAYNLSPDTDGILQMPGIDHRVKELASLVRKYLVEGRFFGVEGFPERANDAVRFMVRLPEGEGYRPAFDAVRSGLEAQGYQLTDIKNFFASGNRFLGLNVTFTSPTGQLFEVQFPTENSERAWILTHDAYEVLRREGSLDENGERQNAELPARRVHALLSMLALNEELGVNDVPPGIDTIVGPPPESAPVGAKSTNLAVWITKNAKIWQQYRAWLDDQQESFAGFGDILAEFGIDPDDVPITPEVAEKLERIDGELLRALRGGQVETSGEGIIVTHGGVDAMLWDHRQKAWVYDPTTVAYVMDHHDYVDRSEEISREQAEELTLQITKGKEALPDEETILWIFQWKGAPPQDDD